MELKDRIIKFIETENLSSSSFADKIGVQRSSISHIISGRNNPSFEFIQKMLISFRDLSADWLLTGSGEIYKTKRKISLFEPASSLFENSEVVSKPASPVSGQAIQDTPEQIDKIQAGIDETKKIDKIIIFYNDKTFSQYFPELE